MTQVQGISRHRFELRDFYLQLACSLCDVSPHDVMSKKQSNRFVVAARRAVIYMLYNDGGLTGSSIAAIMGCYPSTAYQAIKEANLCLQHPRRDPRLASIIHSLSETL